MIKIKAKMVEDDTLELQKYEIKNSNAIEHIALICFLIDEIAKNTDTTREETLETIKDLMKEED